MIPAANVCKWKADPPGAREAMSEEHPLSLWSRAELSEARGERRTLLIKPPREIRSELHIKRALAGGCQTKPMRDKQVCCRGAGLPAAGQAGATAWLKPGRHREGLKDLEDKRLELLKGGGGGINKVKKLS